MTGLVEAMERRGRVGAWPRWIWLVAAAAPAILAAVWVPVAEQFWPGRMLATVAGGLLVALSLTCAYTDLTWRKIPNWATYSAAAWGLAINAVGAFGATESASRPWLGAIGLGESLLGFAACFLIMLMVYRAAGGGAGDVKLAAAIGALLGPERGLNALVLSYIVAGVAIIAWAVWTVGPIRLFGGLARRVGAWLMPGWIAKPSSSQEELLRRPVALGIFFGIGTLTVLAGVDLR